MFHYLTVLQLQSVWQMIIITNLIPLLCLEVILLIEYTNANNRQLATNMSILLSNLTEIYDISKACR